MKKKYSFTPKMDELIRRVYREGGTGRGQVRDLAMKIHLPRWKVSRRAREIGAYEPRIKEPEWSQGELLILERNAHRQPEVIQRRLKEKGFRRSATGIILKRRRMRFLRNLDGYSASQVAEGFGVGCVKTVTRWIHLGLLKAGKRETLRTEQQGGDIFYIKDKYIREFIIHNIGLIDIRKVDKFWFVDILAGISLNE